MNNDRFVCYGLDPGISVYLTIYIRPGGWPCVWGSLQRTKQGCGVMVFMMAMNIINRYYYIIVPS